MNLPLFPIAGNWVLVRDGYPEAYELVQRHYSFRPYVDGRRQNRLNRNRRLFVGPGEKIVLLTVDGKALFIWRKFISQNGQQGVNCAVFRNEGPILSSDLIREACNLAWQRWPGERLYTYVNPQRIRSSNPGCCFKKAGWRANGRTAKGLIILEILPSKETEG